MPAKHMTENSDRNLPVAGTAGSRNALPRAADDAAHALGAGSYRPRARPRVPYGGSILRSGAGAVRQGPQLGQAPGHGDDGVDEDHGRRQPLRLLARPARVGPTGRIGDRRAWD